MRSRLRLAFAPAVFGALRDLTNNYAAALALAGALQCAAAALVLAAKPRRSRRRLRAPRKADDVDPFFPLAVAANALAGFPGPARAYPIAAERMPRRRRRAPLHPHDEPRDDPGCAATRPAPRERHAALQSARPVSSIPPRLGENHPVSTAPLASRSRLLPRGCDAWPPRYSGLVEQNFSPSVGRRFPPVEGVAMPFLPLRLAPLVLAVSVALSGTATASVLVTVNKATQRMTVLVDGETRYSWPVSTGMKGYATPAGTFRPFRLEEEHYSKEWDDAPMPHSIFFTPAGHAIHGSNATRRLGSPASHGCIRIAPANAAKLFALVSAEGLSNTKVVVTGGQVGRVARDQTRQARPPRLRPEPDYGEAAFGGPYYRYPATQSSVW